MALGIATVAASNCKPLELPSLITGLSKATSVLVLLRIWSLWGARKAVIRVTGGVYALIQFSNLGVNVNTIINLTRQYQASCPNPNYDEHSPGYLSICHL